MAYPMCHGHLGSSFCRGGEKVRSATHIPHPEDCGEDLDVMGDHLTLSSEIRDLTFMIASVETVRVERR